MTGNEFIKIWEDISEEEMGLCSKAMEELNNACNFHLCFQNKGITIRWKDLPEDYRKAMRLALVFRLAKLSPRDFMNDIPKL